MVVGIDYSTGARAALLFALHDAARRGVPVEAVVAYRPPDYWMDFYAVSSYHPEKARAAALEHGQMFVDRVHRGRAAAAAGGARAGGDGHRGRRPDRASRTARTCSSWAAGGTAGSPACCWAR